MKNESNVSSYSKTFPATFEFAAGDFLFDIHGKKYLDFFSGAGALNYGHNNPKIKNALLSFIERDSLIHCLDMDSSVKHLFLKRFDEIILQPRNLEYKIQFSGPTGTNAVEAAVKLARKITQRKKIIAFTDSFHGMTATSLALSGSLEDYQRIYPSQEVIFFPFDKFLGDSVDTMIYLEKMVLTEGSGIELPAAIVLETVQAEGGVNVASEQWLRRVAEFCKQHGVILIVDDIQVGCGRTGSFFSFERAKITPDIVLLSKSISGYGLPLSLVLIKPEFDQWLPGEHNGTFRANNLSLCAANQALDFWITDSLVTDIAKKAFLIENRLKDWVNQYSEVKGFRGIGMIWGVEFGSGSIAKKVTQHLFGQGMLIETCGNQGQVIKLLSPLTISEKDLLTGLDLLEDAINHVTAKVFAIR